MLVMRAALSGVKFEELAFTPDGRGLAGGGHLGGFVFLWTALANGAAADLFVSVHANGARVPSIGGAEISDRHANFIVTHEGATAADVLRLIDLARSKIHEQFGVQLELEVQVW